MGFGNRLVPVVVSVVALLFLVVGSPVDAQTNPTVGSYDWWKTALYLEARPGSDRDLGTFQAQVPLSVSTHHMLFADARVQGAHEHRLDQESYEYNLGAGFRGTAAQRGLVWGLYGYYDRLKSPFDSWFQQGTFGGELMVERFEVRGNAYLTESAEETVATGFEPFVTGNTLLIEQADVVETPMDGFDVEVGAKFEPAQVPVWLYGGYFRFDESGFPEVEGPRVRTEAHYRTDVIAQGSRLTFGAEWSEDDFRDDVLFGTVRLRVPLGGSPPPGGDAMEQDRPHWTQLRMAKRVHRDVDIVTSTSTETEQEEPVHPATGEPVNDVYFAANVNDTGAGTVDDPTTLDDAMGREDNHSIVVARSDQGNLVVEETPGERTLGTGEVLMGGGTALVLETPDEGDPVVFTAPGPTGERPTVEGDPDNPGERLIGLQEDASTVRVRGVDFDGNGEWSSGIAGDSVTDVRLTDNSLENFDGPAVALTNAGGSVDLMGNQISGSDTGIFLSEGSGPPLDASLVNNTFQDNRVQVRDPSEALDLDQVLANNTFDRAVTVRENPIAVPTVFSRIQDGVDAAGSSSGDTVQVQAGIYPESVTVDVADLALLGPNAGIPGYSQQRSSEATVEGQVVLSADNTRLDGFDVSPPAATENQGAEAVRVSNTPNDVVVTNNIVRDFEEDGLGQWLGVDGINVFGGDSGESIEDVIVSNNLVQRIEGRNTKGGAAGISIQGNVDGAVVKDNVITEIGMEETAWAFGTVIRGTGNHDVEPKNVEISNNEMTSVLADPATPTMGVGVEVEAGGSGDSYVIENNNIRNNNFGIEVKFLGAEATTINNNNIVGNDTGIVHNGVGELDAAENWWGDAQGPNHPDNPTASTGDTIVGNVLFHPWLDDRFENDPDLTSAVVLTDNDQFFLSIQDGVNAASDSPSDTVAIREGMFEESVLVDVPSVVLTAMDEAAPTVVGQSTRTITIDADNVEVSGLMITNPQGSGDDPGSIGARGIEIREEATGVTIGDNTITDIGTNANTNARGIIAFSGADGLEVRDNEILNLEGTEEDTRQVIAIQIIEEGQSEGTSVTSIENVVIDGNTISNVLDTRSARAIEFNGNITGEITNNSISELNTEGETDQGNPGGFTQAIALNAGGNATSPPQEVTITGNEIFDLETTERPNFAPPTHLILGVESGDVDTIEIQQNEFTAFGDSEFYVIDGTGEFDLQEIRDTNLFAPDADLISDPFDALVTETFNDS